MGRFPWILSICRPLGLIAVALILADVFRLNTAFDWTSNSDKIDQAAATAIGLLVITAMLFHAREALVLKKRLVRRTKRSMPTPNFALTPNLFCEQRTASKSIFRMIPLRQLIEPS